MLMNSGRFKGSALVTYYQTSRLLTIGMNDIAMTFTCFAVSFPTGKLKALLKMFNNCFVQANSFSAFIERL